MTLTEFLNHHEKMSTHEPITAYDLNGYCVWEPEDKPAALRVCKYGEVAAVTFLGQYRLERAWEYMFGTS